MVDHFTKGKIASVQRVKQDIERAARKHYKTINQGRHYDFATASEPWTLKHNYRLNTKLVSSDQYCLEILGIFQPRVLIKKIKIVLISKECTTVDQLLIDCKSESLVNVLKSITVCNL